VRGRLVGLLVLLCLGALVLGEASLARFESWAASAARSGTPCGQMLCSCPSTRITRMLTVTPCATRGDGADLGHVGRCADCGRPVAFASEPGAAPAGDAPRGTAEDGTGAPCGTLAPLRGGTPPRGLLALLVVAPLGLTLTPVAPRAPGAAGVWRPRPRRRVAPLGRWLGVEPPPPRR